MTTTETTPVKSSTDLSIELCQETIKKHRFRSNSFLYILVFIPVFAGTYFGFESYLAFKLIGTAYSMPNTDAKTNYILYLLLIVVFSIFTSLYRFHSKEIAKYEHFLLGFMRIRIAATNNEPGYQTEVRQSLTHEAFTYDTKPALITKGRKVENPVPGNPTSDIGTAIINKIFESIEIVQKKKGGS